MIEERIKRLNRVVDVLQQRSERLFEKHLNHLGIFGSVARSEGRPRVDVDLLVKIDRNARMLLTDFSSLRVDLIDLLGQDVDVGGWSTLKEDLGHDVRKDAIKVF